MVCKQRQMETPRFAANFSRQHQKLNAKSVKEVFKLSVRTVPQGRVLRASTRPSYKLTLSLTCKRHSTEIHIYTIHVLNIVHIRVVASYAYIKGGRTTYNISNLNKTNPKIVQHGMDHKNIETGAFSFSHLADKGEIQVGI